MTTKTESPRPKKGGRPANAYGKRVGRVLCERVAMGESLADACAGLGVAREAVRERIGNDPDFADGYKRAKEFRGDGILDEIEGIAQGLLAEKIGIVKVQAIQTAIESLQHRYELLDHELEAAPA